MRKDAPSPARTRLSATPEAPPASAAPASTTPGGPFRIHAIAELTGVPEPTVRARERRYGVPSPERTTAGYRLYGAKELNLVRDMLRLCAGGMSAAEAAAGVRSGARDPVAATLDEPRANDPHEAARDRSSPRSSASTYAIACRSAPWLVGGSAAASMGDVVRSVRGNGSSGGPHGRRPSPHPVAARAPPATSRSITTRQMCFAQAGALSVEERAGCSTFSGDRGVTHANVQNLSSGAAHDAETAAHADLVNHMPLLVRTLSIRET